MGCAGTDEKKDQIPLDAADFVRDVENRITRNSTAFESMPIFAASLLFRNTSHTKRVMFTLLTHSNLLFVIPGCHLSHQQTSKGTVKTANERPKSSHPRTDRLADSVHFLRALFDVVNVSWLMRREMTVTK
jgi:hypothetical protein